MNTELDLEKSYSPRGMLLVTGESYPQGHSSTARILPVQMKPGDIDKQQLSHAQSSGEYLRKAMADYICWLAPQMENLKEELPKKFFQYRDDFHGLGVHGRTGDALAFLKIGLDYFLLYMKHATACNDEKERKILNVADRTFRMMAEQQNGILNEEEPSELFLRTLAELLLTKKVYVTPINGRNAQVNLPAPSVQVGYYDTDYYYLNPAVTFSEVSKVLHSSGEKFPVSKTTLWKLLDEANAIRVERDTKGNVQRTIKVAIPDTNGPNRPRMLHLKKAALDENTASVNSFSRPNRP